MGFIAGSVTLVFFALLLIASRLDKIIRVLWDIKHATVDIKQSKTKRSKK